MGNPALYVASSLAVAATLGSVAKAAERVGVEEYGFSAVLPEGVRTCYGDSGGHVHGVYGKLDGQGCRSSHDGPAISIWADYNASFVVDALAYLREYTECRGGDAQWPAGEWRRSVGGRPTAFCRVVLPNGAINLVLLAQTGQWGPGFGDEETRTPRIFYTVRLGTTHARYEKDLKTFRAFVRSIDVDDRAY